MLFTASPAAANNVNGINNKDNGVVDNGGWRGRSVRLSTLLCTKSVGLWRASSYDYEDVMNNRDKDKDASWESA